MLYLTLFLRTLHRTQPDSDEVICRAYLEIRAASNSARLQLIKLSIAALFKAIMNPKLYAS